LRDIAKFISDGLTEIERPRRHLHVGRRAIDEGFGKVLMAQALARIVGEDVVDIVGKQAVTICAEETLDRSRSSLAAPDVEIKAVDSHRCERPASG
jgi:hypothetical protein